MAFRVSSVLINIFAVILIISDSGIHVSCLKDLQYETDYQLSTDELSVVSLEERHRRQTIDNGTNVPTTAMPGQQTTTAPVNPTTALDKDLLNRIHDDHVYYSSDKIQLTEAGVNDFWVELINVTGHQTLSDSHRTAVTASLPFNFPFYGHRISNVTIATGGFLYISPFIHKFLTATQYIAPLMANFDTKTGGPKSTVLYKQVGFLYMSPFLHQWLTATQYIAPLMANFDTELGNTSEIVYMSFDSRFVVEWRDVYLQDQNSTAFRFQAILHRNGSIVFVYKNVPIPVSSISEQAHPVKVGLSDAFYYDTTSFGTRRRTIYEYHRVSLNKQYIRDNTLVMIHPLPTCNLYTDCETCVSTNIKFECRWCGIINRCSDSVDWHRQKWIDAGCVHLSGSANCSLIPTTVPQSSKQTVTPEYRPVSTHSGNGTQVAVIVVVVVILIALIGGIGAWIFYAYSHPTSASGMWLMEHRPSQMKAKLNNMKFWKRNTSSGDKYAVESTA